MPFYSCFGIDLHSPIKLPLPAADKKPLPDVNIHRAHPAPLSAKQFSFSFSDDDGLSQIKLLVSGIGQFTISKGSRITIQPDLPSPPDSIFALYLTGSVLSLLLYQRGLLILHGSVVNIAGQAVAFLGHSGAGKSSAAAACCTQGHGLVADDAAAIKVGAGGGMVIPGFPRLKVHGRTAAALDIDPAVLTALADGGDEFLLQLDTQFTSSPIPLSAIYLLDNETEQPSINSVAPAAALIALLPHALPSRYGHSGGAHQFAQLAELVKQVPVCRFQRPKDLSLLHLVPGLVQEHLRSLGQTRQG